jgi:hypothetical protein
LIVLWQAILPKSSEWKCCKFTTFSDSHWVLTVKKNPSNADQLSKLELKMKKRQIWTIAENLQSFEHFFQWWPLLCVFNVKMESNWQLNRMLDFFKHNFSDLHSAFADLFLWNICRSLRICVCRPENFKYSNSGLTVCGLTYKICGLWNITKNWLMRLWYILGYCFSVFYRQTDCT